MSARVPHATIVGNNRGALPIDAFETARRQLGPEQWLEVRYEDVLAQPEDTFGTILHFLGLPPDQRFEEALARYEFRPTRTDAFVRDLAPQALRLLDTSLAEHLARLGYAEADVGRRAGSG